MQTAAEWLEEVAERIDDTENAPKETALNAVQAMQRHGRTTGRLGSD